MQDKNCARCGRRFGCGRDDAGCWCQTLPPLPPARLRVGTDCLCPECLAAALAETTPAGDGGHGADPDPAA